MSINSCTINETSIDSLCGSRRALTILNLQQLLPNQPIFYPGHHPQHVRKDVRVPLLNFRRDQALDDLEESLINLELPQLTVTVTCQGETFAQTLDRDNGIPMVSVYGVRTVEDDLYADTIKTLRAKVLAAKLGINEETVTITNLRTRVLP